MACNEDTLSKRPAVLSTLQQRWFGLYLSVCFLCGSCGPLCGSLRGLPWSAFRSAFLRHSFSAICLSFAASAAVLSHNTNTHGIDNDGKLDISMYTRSTSRPEFAFLLETFLTGAEDDHFIAKWRITGYFSYCVGLTRRLKVPCSY